MQKYVQIYLTALGYTDTDFIPSELSGIIANDIHHIISRGKKGENRIENLIAVTREEHLKYGDRKEWMYFLLLRHYNFLVERKVNFCKGWFEEMFNKYKEINAY
jgi:HNH endonuclease